MESTAVLRCDDAQLHLRPAAEIVAFLSLFADCDIAFNTGDLIFDPRSVVVLSSSNLTDGKRVSIAVKGEDEEIVLILVTTFLENLYLVARIYEEKNPTDERFREGRTSMFVKLEKALQGRNSEKRWEYLEMIRRRFGLAPDQRVCTAEAVLRSEGGLHVIPCTFLPKVARRFMSAVELLYNTPKGKPSSCSITDLPALMSTELKNGAVVVVRATGSDCQEAARVVRRVLEAMDEIKDRVRACGGMSGHETEIINSIIQESR